MNSRYIYKAKRIDSDEEIQGSLIQNSGMIFIHPLLEEKRLVNYKTICESSSFIDSELNHIFENDYVKDENGNVYQVIFEMGAFLLYREQGDIMDLIDNAWNDNVYPLCQWYWEHNCRENCLYNLTKINKEQNNEIK